MADTNEYDHTELDFSNLDRGDDYFLKHRDEFVPTLNTLLKRVDPNGTEFNPETLNASEASINDNRSLSAPLDHNYYGAAVDGTGTHYALRHDGADLILETGGDGDLDNGLSETHRWAGISDQPKVEPHITAGGALLVGVEGSIYRSTDGGDSFTTVQSLTGAATFVWTFTENGAGSILATEHNSRTVRQSTDDGASWSVFADETDFGEFPTHVHRARYHPANDYIIVTGGDGGGQGFYRSTDDGTSWDFHRTGNQCVAIGTHPTNGSVYWVASDADDFQAPIYSLSDDGSSITSVGAQGMNLEGVTGAASGSFPWTTVERVDTTYHIAATINQDTNRLAVSADVGGYNWRFVDSVAEASARGPFGATKGPGPYEHHIDGDAISQVIVGDRIISTDVAASRPLYGAAGRSGIDSRSTMDHIQFGDREHRLKHDHSTDLPQYVWEVNPDTDPTMLGFVSGGKYTIRDLSNNVDLLRVNPKAAKVETMDVPVRTRGGTGGGAIELGTGGAEIYVNTNGEVVVVDEAGNETVVS